VRGNYMTPASMRFYGTSHSMYAGLSQELDFNLLYTPRGLLWMAHSEAQLQSVIERTLKNQAFGLHTEFLDPDEIHKLCPQVDTTGGGTLPVLGASHHVTGAIVRHDAVVWGYASQAQRRGVHVHQGVEVTGLAIERGRCVGVETSAGPIAAGAVLSAVGGYVTTIASMAGIRLPIVSHPLQAFVTESYKPALSPVVIAADMHLYVSQSARGEFLIGAEIDPYTSYATRSTFPFLASAAARSLVILPFLAKLKILRQWTGICDMTPDYSQIMGLTGIDGFYITTGWGSWGFKAIPASGLSMAELIATGKVPELIAPFALDRFERDRAIADRASAGTH
jgi:sarcosine oxidase, subunit beta